MKSTSLFFIIVLFLITACDTDEKITISLPDDNAQISFAVEEVKAALSEKHIAFEITTDKDADILFRINKQNTNLKPEGFVLSNDDDIVVEGFDAAGAMYGGLELAEQIRIFGIDGIHAGTQNPHMQLRGTKHNIPLDVRTPSYTDPCDAAQQNIAEMWSFDFWKEYIDNMARYRYNYISLWNLHPFPSMVRVPSYEDVALDNVQRSTVKWKEFYNGNGVGFDAPEIINNVEVLKKMTIDEKMDFWRKVMAYGKSRNVDFYIITWNIFVNGTNGKYGITDKIDNPVTRDYFRKSVKQMFIEYPNLKGIGLTTGENMHGSGFEEKEQWAFETYGQGTLDAAKEMPDRNIVFVHRQHQTGAQDIARTFKPLVDAPNVEFIFSFKYAKAHVMSATKQPYHTGFVKDIGAMKTLWTLRNDDNYLYRWGAPDFVRTFIQNIPIDVSRGFYYGSDQWIWGREFTMNDDLAESPRQIEIVKHWYHFLLWGRLGYDPTITNERFVQILESHFAGVDGQKLFTAWQSASMIYPTTTGFHWGPLDFQWYIEACKSRPGYAQNKTGFHDVNRFINLPPHSMSGFQSIPDFVKNGKNDKLKSPQEVADMLHNQAKTAFDNIAQINAESNKELAITLHDIKTMALLGDYYGFKIAGATQLALYRESKDKKYQDAAVAELEKALAVWKKYTEASLQQNKNPLWTNRVGYVDWNNLTKWAADDIKIAKEG